MKRQVVEMSVVHPHAAGIDIGSKFHCVAVPKDRDPQSVRTFLTYTEDLHKIAQWLKECEIETVAMESTGVYWIPLYVLLEEYGFEVYLVNAKHVKNVTGRKTDIKDCQWLQQLHSCGLLQKSFQPDNLTRELRSYVRQRRNLVESASSYIQKMQKALDQMNIRVHAVISDISGVSGIRIIEAMLGGERDAKNLATLADNRIKASKAEIEKALIGTWREEHLFELNHAYEFYQFSQMKIKECDSKIEQVMQKYEKQGTKSTSNVKIDKKGKGRKSLNFDLDSYLRLILGVDITKIFGLKQNSALEIISEVGIDMSKWATEKHFVSWLNLAPNNKITGGKVIKSRIERKKNKAGQAFKMAASTLKNSQNFLGSFFRRIKAKGGPAKAIAATARKMAVIWYKMIKEKKEFAPVNLEKYEEAFRQNRINYLQSQLKKMGLAAN